MTNVPAIARVPAISYTRVSTEEQDRADRTSIRDQEAAIRQLAERLGSKIDTAFSDPGVSGATAEKRPGFMALIAYCRTHPRTNDAPGYVLVLNDSRWGRFADPEEATYWRVECRRLGWIVRFAEGDETEDLLARGVLRTIHSAQATAYREAIRANARRGAYSAAAEGWWLTEAPLGYRRQEYRDGSPTDVVLEVGERKRPNTRVRLTPGPEHEQEFIRWLFESYATGTISLGQLVSEAKQRMPNRRWSRQTLRAVLRNPAYVGDVVVGRRPNSEGGTQRYDADEDRWIRCHDAHPLLVSREVFARVQTVLKQHKKQTRATRGGYLLSGLVRCAHCGEPYVGAGGPKGPPGDPDRYRFYRDRGGVEPPVQCDGILGTLQRRIVEPMVIEAIGEVVSGPVVQEAIAEEFDRMVAAARGSATSRAHPLRAERAATERQRKRLIQAIADGTIEKADAAEAMRNLRARREALDTQIERLQFAQRQESALAGERERILGLARDFPALAKRLSGPQLRELVRPWLQDAVVDKYERTLTLTIRRIPTVSMFAVLEPRPGPNSR